MALNGQISSIDQLPRLLRASRTPDGVSDSSKSYLSLKLSCL